MLLRYKSRGVRMAAMLVGMALLTAPCPTAVRAENAAKTTGVKTAFADQAFARWLDELRKEARAKGISEATLDAAFSDIQPVRRVIELDRRQPEFVETFADYMRRRVTDQRVKRGRALLEKHRDLLTQIYAEYGVPPHYIIAFWGLETAYGEYTGRFQTINALTTLAYDTRRAGFFRAQLLDALKILEQGHIAPEAMKGSWAGAMGQMQFIPSTFLAYAVDYTGNGRKNIWDSLPDAFASAANFLASVGWQQGERWGRKVQLPLDFDTRLAGLDTRKPLKQWAALGVRRENGAPLPRADMEGAVVMPDGPQGPAFLVYNNFRVILRWNNSINYAISVGQLADRIKGGER